MRKKPKVKVGPATDLVWWRGAGGAAYTKRNDAGERGIQVNLPFYKAVVKTVGPVKSVLEIGCNVGTHLVGLSRLLPKTTRFVGIEPNVEAQRRAAVYTAKLPNIKVQDGVATRLVFKTGEFDLSFTRGVLIHIWPKELNQAIDELVRVSNRFVVIGEYNVPRANESSRRGGRGYMCWRRDYQGRIQERHPKLKLLAQGNGPAPKALRWFIWEKT